MDRYRRSLGLVTAFLAALALPAAISARTIRPDDITLTGNFTVSAAVTGLASPTMVAFDDQGRMLIAESGYDASGPARLSRLETNGTLTSLFQVPQEEVPLTAVAVYGGTTYLVTAATVWRLEGSDGGSATPIISDLPGLGDHQANQIAFVGDRLYLAIGTVTNSAVVGADNAIFGWLEMPERRDVHDIPCEDIVIAGEPFTAANPFGAGTVQTSPYSAFGTTVAAGTTIPGDVRCNGAILSSALDGSDLRVEAWGLRNPYGLKTGPDSELYIAMHGDDARGSRPIEDAPDCFYRFEPGAWYGWPDFACDLPVTDPRFRPVDKPQPQFVIANHPTDSPPRPIAKFDPHAGANGFAFSPGDPWGPTTDVFVALFGDATPATGTVPRPQGVAVVRLDTITGLVSPFMGNVIAGEASEHGLGGIEHPSDVTFGPDGAMYVTDWGAFRDTLEGLQLEPQSGVVWRIAPVAGGGAAPLGLPSGLILNGAILFGLALLTFVFAAGRTRHVGIFRGAFAGAVGAVAMGIFTMFIAAPILAVPWFAAPRVLATIPMGRVAVANIVEFEPVSFSVGLLVLLALGIGLGLVFSFIARAGGSAFRVAVTGVLLGLTVWAAAQWFVLPVLFPLISDKGLPPLWLAASLALLGGVMGLVSALGLRSSRQPA